MMILTCHNYLNVSNNKYSVQYLFYNWLFNEKRIFFFVLDVLYIFGIIIYKSVHEFAVFSL